MVSGVCFRDETLAQWVCHSGPPHGLCYPPHSPCSFGNFQGWWYWVCVWKLSYARVLKKKFKNSGLFQVMGVYSVWVLSLTFAVLQMCVCVECGHTCEDIATPCCFMVQQVCGGPLLAAKNGPPDQFWLLNLVLLGPLLAMGDHFWQPKVVRGDIFSSWNWSGGPLLGLTNFCVTDLCTLVHKWINEGLRSLWANQNQLLISAWVELMQAENCCNAVLSKFGSVGSVREVILC